MSPTPEHEFARKYMRPDDDHYTRMLTLILERQDHLIDKIEQVDKAVSELDGELKSHMVREEGAIGKWMDSLPKKTDGSPDVEGHAAYHISIIQESRDRAEMWRDLRKTIVAKGAMGLMGVIGLLIVYWWNREVMHK